MEGLILKCGRFVPAAELDTESRIKAMESYLSYLTQELEYTVSQLDRALIALTAKSGASVGSTD